MKLFMYSYLEKYRKYRLLSILLLFCIIGLVLSPYIDIPIAAYPFNSSINRFYGQDALWCLFLYYSIPYISYIMIASPILFLVFRLMKYKKIKSNLMVFILIYYLSFAIGPGLLVNGIFKNYWGRARPIQVIRDHQEYSKFWQRQPNKPDNNSFPSGHASVAFFVGVPLLIVGRRNYGLLLSCGFGGLIGFVRILQGGHFLSDVIMAFVIVWFSAELINYGIRRYVRK